MSKFDMFESRKEIRLDSSRVKRKLLVIKTATNSARLRHVSTCPLLALKKPISEAIACAALPTDLPYQVESKTIVFGVWDDR